MKSARFVGQAIAVCLYSVLAISPTAQVGSPSRIRSNPPLADSVVVWHQEAGQHRLAAELPIVLQVRTLIAGAVEVQSPDGTMAKTVRRTLTERFGTLMTESASPPRYVWVLIEGQWVLVCLTATEFQVDFGRWGHVVVQATDEMPVD